MAEAKPYPSTTHDPADAAALQAALHATQAELARHRELLQLARGFGRLGLWERNVRTMQGSWDREVMRFWGLHPQQAAPAYAEALHNVVEADRQALDHHFRESLRQAGRYATRYRVQGFDGTLRRLHSQWVVVNGEDGQPERALGVMTDDSEPFALAANTNELESQLALAVDLGGIAIWRHDLLSGRIHANPQGWRALGLAPPADGYTVEQGRALVHPEDLQRLEASAETALQSNQPVDVEARFRHADGSWRPQLVRRMVLRNASAEPVAILGVALDITQRTAERRRADEMARRFETATRAAGIGHWIHEPGQPRPFWSEQLRTLYGLARGTPTPTMREWLKTLVHPEDVQRLRDSTMRWLASGAERTEISFRARLATGEVRELFAHSQQEAGSGGPLLFGVVIDLSERRRSEQALKGAQDRVALVARAAGLGTWELDLASDELHWDEQMWLLRGRTPGPQPVSAEERRACAHPEDREAAERGMREAIRSGHPFDHEFRVVWPDGSVHWLASRSMEISDPDSSGRRRRIGVNWDITDARTADTVRQEREIALRESASKSKFLARMSHELRTPLNAVLGFSQLLLSEDPGSDAAGALRRRRLEHIRNAGQHLLTLINDVLSLSALEGGEVQLQLQPVLLRTLLEEALPMVAALQQQHQLPVSVGALDLHVLADATRLRQVLLNLLSNALKYNRPGGSVRVEAQRRGAAVLLRVADTGRGMSDEQMQHLFEPFNRLGADRGDIEGTGIGLAIVKALVERMQGSVHVDSRLGEGSVFELRLVAAAAPDAAPDAATLLAPVASPLYGAPTASGAPGTPGASAVASVKSHAVLYIEDNPVNALLIHELLRQRGDITLHLAADGSNGIRQAQALRPALILLDMQLPDFDGFEVLRRLQADPRTAGIPCVALSANAMPADIQRALHAGMADYWTKPLDFKGFMAALDQRFGAAPAR